MLKKKTKVHEEEAEYLNDEEKDALESGTSDESSSSVSTKKMEKTVALLEKMFHLEDKSFSVTSFTDKGKSVKLSMTNGDFDVSVTVNDAEATGLMTDTTDDED